MRAQSVGRWTMKRKSKQPTKSSRVVIKVRIAEYEGDVAGFVKVLQEAINRAVQGGDR